ncbi:hypothetical protein GCM10017781_33160 [Deinococcus metalli]|uniref:Uncharacterized protein n=1 Tax=Deinococcus metalli TaxID=1141878 RepID=A0ABQ3JRP8_9DEIO|nr:hypothetical protein GCM10017781_33160 [Deinococcus metalli]
MVALADVLPPQVIALVHGVAPLAETYWMGSSDTPAEIRRLVRRARQGLGRKRSNIRPAHTCWMEARARR